MKEKNNIMVLALFLLGIFMGAIDSGIVSPAREIIQNSFGVQRNVGMWMITIYTLSYAISMPIVSKMADRYGYKKVYLFGISTFALGSLLCGISNIYGGFTFFLTARVVQAIGGGGIMPIATTVIGQSFPEEKRGTALGLVGAIYGVATIIGPTLGSFILTVAGNENWGWIFLINIPISIIILILSVNMKDAKTSQVGCLDLAGAVVTAGVIGSIMYALTNLDFFNFSQSIKDVKVYPYLIIFIVLIPILIWVENKAKDPILNLKYFKDKQILTIMILAFIVGVGMMGMIFVPQFAENVLKIKAGTGGYLVTLLAVFSGIAAPLSGKLLDKKGARFVMMLGFLFTIAGTLILGYITTKTLNFISIMIGLALMGFGVGFTMGAPLNYLALESVPKSEGASALATMSLMRSIGVTISPSIMIGFVVNASKSLQSNLMVSLQDVTAGFMQGGSIPTSASGSGNTAKIFASLQTADVTNIVDKLKDIFKQITPNPAQGVILQKVEGMRQSLESTFQFTINIGYTNMFTAAAIIAGMGLIMTLFLNKSKA